MSDVISTPDSLQPSTIDFNSLHEKAMEHTADPTADTAEPLQDVATSAPSDLPDSALAGTPTVTGSHDQVVDIPDDALVRVKIDGVEETVPYAEYKGGIQREAAFTRRMQTLSQQRQEAEQVFTQRAAELQRQAEMIAYAQEQMQTAARPTKDVTSEKPSDPNEIATLGEVQQSLAAFQQQLSTQQTQQQQQFMSQLQNAGHELKNEQIQQADAHRFTAGLNATLEKDDYKFLRDVIPYAEESIRYQVAQLDPQSIDQAIDYTETVAKEWSDRVRATSTDHIKRQEVAKARAKMGPPSGSPVPPSEQTKPGSFMRKDGKLDWKSLEQRAAAYLDN
jgi:hypothetical protein